MKKPLHSRIIGEDETQEIQPQFITLLIYWVNMHEVKQHDQKFSIQLPDMQINWQGVIM